MNFPLPQILQGVMVAQGQASKALKSRLATGMTIRSGNTDSRPRAMPNNPGFRSDLQTA